MVRICIVDDEKDCSDRFESFIARYFSAHGGAFEVAVFRDGAELVKRYMPVYDIIYLDIEMPGLDGMSTAARIREQDGNTVIIFLTRLGQFAINGYEVNAFDYIVKPLDYNSFEIKFSRALRAARQKEDYKVEIITAREHIWMSSSQICRIEVDKHELTYYTTGGTYSMRGSLGEAEKKLRPYGFRPCSRYCLVNMRYVKGIYDWYILVNGEKVEVSRSRRRQMLEELVGYFGGNQ